MRKQLYTIATNSLSRVLTTPPYIILFVSDKCTNNCRHCWYSKEWKEKNLNGQPLSFDELEKISKSIPSIKFLTITGGEAFLREDIEEIIHVFLSNSRISRYDIPTSGFDSDLISQKVENILTKNNKIPFRVDVSLDGLEETHNSIRQNRNAFENAVKTIGSLRRIKARYSNFDLAIISTVSNYNNNEIKELGQLIKHILPDGEWMVNIIRGESPGLAISAETASAYRMANDIIHNRIKQKEFTGDRAYGFGKWITAKNALRRELITEIIESKRIGGGCAAGSLSGVIFNDGDVRPCEMLSSSFGNIRDFDYNLPQLWNSPKAKQIRKEIQYSQCICTHECNLSVNILLQPSCWFRLLNKRIFDGI
ncbi:MAG: radical SAM protein [FCB group bacterium]|jgi:MoaA/NifB/PqqE/SkfB family radical SAM enzyme